MIKASRLRALGYKVDSQGDGFYCVSKKGVIVDSLHKSEFHNFILSQGHEINDSELGFRDACSPSKIEIQFSYYRRNKYKYRKSKSCKCGNSVKPGFGNSCSHKCFKEEWKIA